MKKFCFILLVLGCLSMKGQVWQFNQLYAPYSTLDSTAAHLSPGYWWWGSQAIPIQLPFQLSIGTITSSQWFIRGNGEIVNDTNNTTSSILGFGLALVDRSYFGGVGNQSPILFKTIGTSPNRVGIIEFSNAGIYYGDSTDFVNFQIFIHETSNTIEYHYGLSQFSGMSGDPFIGIANNAHVNQLDYYLIDGLTTSPSLVHITNSANFVTTEVPLDSTIYQFTKVVQPNSTIPLNTQNVQLYPVPCNQSLQITMPSEHNVFYRLYQMNGIIVRQGTCTSKQYHISTESLPDGIYYLHLVDDGTIIQKKIVIHHGD